MLLSWSLTPVTLTHLQSYHFGFMRLEVTQSLSSHSWLGIKLTWTEKSVLQKQLSWLTKTTLMTTPRYPFSREKMLTTCLWTLRKHC